jgi:signal transduction histidine kinase
MLPADQATESAASPPERPGRSGRPDLAERAAPARRASAGRRLVAGLVLPVASAAIAVAGLHAHVPGGIPALTAVAFGLVLAGALSGAVLAQAPERTPEWQVAFGSLAGAVAFAAARFAASGPGRGQVTPHGAAMRVATLALPLVIACFTHMLLGLPDGRLRRPGDRGGRARRAGAVLVYALAGLAGVSLAVAGRALPAGAVAVAWVVVTACALPAVRRRYLAAAGRDRERMQWMGVGTVLAGDAALAATVLHVLVGWPGPLAAVVAGCAFFLPLAVIAAGVRGLGGYGGRALVQVISVAGFTAVAAAIYLVIVLGIGTTPRDPADQELLGLSMLAAAAAAAAYLPIRDRLLAWAKRYVYGAREAPDEALRTFGSRLSRAIPMEELLLQLAESLRKTMALTSAEIYTGSGDVLERSVSVPDAGGRSIVITPQELPVVTRAPVSGAAWAAVWLPALVDGRGDAQLRVAPVSNGGHLLGLIVAERPAAADSFTEEDDRVLTELARQVGLAFHNAQLDAALQTTLDELRAQAVALRESRARIVASGDAERRRLERDLHDGAQQSLVALAVNLRLARDMITDEPAEAEEMLAQAAGDIQHAVQELRELAHGIYPPLLAGSGLPEALRAAAARSPLDVTVTSENVGRYTPEIEAAVYFCCLEALQNAAKHAPAATVAVRLREEAGGLLFSVTDDGPGFDPATVTASHGFINMADRLGANGGTIRWQSAPGQGAQIHGSIPLVDGGRLA